MAAADPTSALTRWLWGTVAAGALTAAGGTIATVQATTSRVAVTESRVEDLRGRLYRIEKKLDQILDVLPRHRQENDE